MKNKILLFYIIAHFAPNIVAVNVKISELSAGDIVNINELNFQFTNTYGNIFNGNRASQFIKVRNFDNVERIRVENKSCLPFKELVSYHYPKVKINDTSFVSPEIYNYTRRDNVFDIHPYYINKNFSYGILKVCKVVKSKKVFSEMLYEKDFPIVDNLINYKLLLDKTAVLKFKPKNGSHYIQYLTTGECLVQTYVNTAEFCQQRDQSKVEIKNFINSSRFKSRVKIVNSNPDREKHINDYMNLIGMSLLHLTESSIQKSFYRIFAPIPEQSIIKLNLGTFPNLPEKLLSPSIAHEAFINDIVPGDVINVNDLKHLHSLDVVDNFLVDVYDHNTSPFTHFDYTHCYLFHKDDALRLEFVPYILRPNHSADSFYKFGVFDEVLMRKNYGVDPMYLNNQYKCLKIKICSGFERTKLIIPSVYVVNLDKNDPDKSRIFDSKNVVLRYKLSNETHYVARTEKGNCLFQALIYENLDDSSHNQEIQGPLLYKGRILSSNSNQSLEKWAEQFVSDFPIKSYKTLVELINNRTALEAIYSKLTHRSYSNTMINIYLDKLH